MAGTYDEETRRLLENRRRKAALRREEQAKKRNRLLVIIGGVAVIVLLVIVLCVSCSSGKDKGKDKDKQEIVTTQQETTVPETTIPETTTMPSMYTTDALNLRKQPNTDADIITTIGAGKRVDIISEEGKWCKVQRGKDIGYVMKKYLSYKQALD